MPPSTLTPAQAAIVAAPPDRRIWLEGPAGAGKTTAAGRRGWRDCCGREFRATRCWCCCRSVRWPRPSPARLRQPTTPAGGEVTIVTLGGLAQRTVELFWPLVAAEAGFAQPNRPPVFLTLETAQYFMARVVGPLLAEGYFDAIVVDRNRLYSQILDNLNKAALVGFPHTEIGARLAAAWTGESSQARVYAEAQECATRFRDYCLAHNLLDFSLQYELFARGCGCCRSAARTCWATTATSSRTTSRRTRRSATTSCSSGCRNAHRRRSSTTPARVTAVFWARTPSAPIA